MSPRKTTRKDQPVSGPKAPVVSLASYRQPTAARPRTLDSPSDANLDARHALVAAHVCERVEALAPGAVAVALVLLRADGTLDISATGIEPEYIPFITRGLDGIASAIRRRMPHRRADPSQSGLVTLAFLSAIGFMMATYVNEYAWLDALLSLSAQAFAAQFWRTQSKQRKIRVGIFCEKKLNKQT